MMLSSTSARNTSKQNHRGRYLGSMNRITQYLPLFFLWRNCGMRIISAQLPYKSFRMFSSKLPSMKSLRVTISLSLLTRKKVGRAFTL